MNKIRPIILCVAVALISLVASNVFKGLSLNTLFASITLGKTALLILAIVLSLVFCLLFALECIRGRVKPVKLFKKSGMLLLGILVTFILGQVAVWIYSASSGYGFKFYGKIPNVSLTNIIVWSSLVVMFAMAVLLYLRGRAKAVRNSSSSMRANASVNAAKQYAYATLYGTMILAIIPVVVLMFVSGNSQILWLPMACATFAMVLLHMTGLRLWLFIAVATILLQLFPAIQYMYMTASIGGLGINLIVALMDAMILMPLIDLYVMPGRKKKN